MRNTTKFVIMMAIIIAFILLLICLFLGTLKETFFSALTAIMFFIFVALAVEKD